VVISFVVIGFFLLVVDDAFGFSIFRVSFLLTYILLSPPLVPWVLASTQHDSLIVSSLPPFSFPY